MYSQKIKDIDFRKNTFLLLAFISITCFVVFTEVQPDSWPVWIQITWVSYFSIITATLTYLFKKVNMISWDFYFKKQFHNTKPLGSFCIIFGILGLPILIGAFFIFLGTKLNELDKSDKEGLQIYQKDENYKAIKYFIIGYILFILFMGVVNIVNARGLIQKPKWLQIYIEIFISLYFLAVFFAFERAWGIIQLEIYKKDFSKIGLTKNTRQSLLSPMALIAGFGMLFIFGIFITLTYVKMWNVEKVEGPNGPNWNSFKKFKV